MYAERILSRGFKAVTPHTLIINITHQYHQHLGRLCRQQFFISSLNHFLHCRWLKTLLMTDGSEICERWKLKMAAKSNTEAFISIPRPDNNGLGLVRHHKTCGWGNRSQWLSNEKSQFSWDPPEKHSWSNLKAKLKVIIMQLTSTQNLKSRPFLLMMMTN